MQWYWIALVLGAIVAPWVTMSKTLRIAFEERGLMTGIAVWFGVALVTTPLMFLIMWVGRLFI